MAVVLFVFTLFSIAVFGMIALLARAVRARTPPNERRDLEDNSITREEWEWVRHARCGPTHCPRALGSPPHPRGDVVCEICAAVFMERHWRRLLGITPAGDLTGVRSRARAQPEHAVALRTAAGKNRPTALPMLEPDGWESIRTPPPPRRARMARLAVRLGFALALTGASVLALTAAVFAGYVLIACGIGLVLRSRHAGG